MSKKLTFRDAKREFPSEINPDSPQETINDLVVMAQSELDACNNEPDQYDYMTRKEFGDFKSDLRSYIRKYEKAGR